MSISSIDPNKAAWWPRLVLGLAVLSAVAGVVIPVVHTSSALELGLMQAITVGLSISSAYVLGKQSARAAAIEMMQPHARSAFRRQLSLYKSLDRLAQTIEAERQRAARSGCGHDILLAVVNEQIVAAGDALEDWRDIIPHDIEQLERRVLSQQVSTVRSTHE